MKYAKVYAEDVNIGDALPELVKGPIQQIQLTRYAGASGACKGRVLGKSSKDGTHLIELELSAENQKGEKVVTGKATVALPSRES